MFSPSRFARYRSDLFRAVKDLHHEVKGRDIRRRYGVRYSTQEMPVTPIDRLKEKFLQARGVAQRVATNMEAEADSLIAEEDAMKAQTVEAFAPHKAILGDAKTELQAIKDALNLMSNGGPPLDVAEKPIAPLKPTVVSEVVTRPSSAQSPNLADAPFAIQSLVSTPVDDTGEVDRIKLNSVQTG